MKIYMITRLFYRGPSFALLHEEYAENGRIDEKAPVQSSANTYVNIPIERVWDLLINLSEWQTIDSSFNDLRLETGINSEICSDQTLS